MSKALLVALGGAAGALARYWLGGKINSYWPMPFPLGTFVVNVSGSFIIGFTMALIGERIAVSPSWRLLIAVGFVGAYTTFSTYEYETLKLIEEGNVLSAALNIVLSVILGFAAVWMGSTIARRIPVPQAMTTSVQAVMTSLSKPGPKTGD